MITASRLICLLALLLLPSSAHADTDQILLDYIPEKRITRFEEPVNFWIGGKDRLEGQYYVDTVMDELGRIIPHLATKQVSSASQANIRFYLTDSQEEWQEAITKSAEGAAGWQEMGQRIRGFTRLVAAPGGNIKRSDIVLHLDYQTSGGQKLWIVRHELMHALGITQHPTATTDSVLNSRQEQQDKNSNFSDSDILVLQTIYSPKLAAGGTW